MNLDARDGRRPEPEPPSLFAGAAAVLFDLDGTLIETHIDFPLMKREVLAIAARQGLATAQLADLDILGVVEEARAQLIERGDAEAGERLRVECFDVLRRIEVDQCANPVEIDGAAELVARLQGLGLPVGIVTRNSRAVSERLLDRAGIQADTLVARDDVARTKPDPLHLFEALARLGVPSASARDVVMIGDHAMDIQAGRAAGMRTIGVLNGGPADRFAVCVPDVVAPTTGDILALLSRMSVEERGGE